MNFKHLISLTDKEKDVYFGFKTVTLRDSNNVNTGTASKLLPIFKKYVRYGLPKKELEIKIRL